MSDEIPRRFHLDKSTPAELAIRAAVDAAIVMAGRAGIEVGRAACIAAIERVRPLENVKVLPLTSGEVVTILRNIQIDFPDVPHGDGQAGTAAERKG